MSTWASPFQEAADMETPVRIVTDLLVGIGLIASTIDDDQANAIGAIVQLAEEKMKLVEELRGKLFDATHPNREHFEQVGWPGKAGAQ